MIKAKDLRIGNFLQSDVFIDAREPEIDQVAGIVENAIYLFSHPGPFVLSDWKGIPICAEILEKCGFVRIEPQPGIVQYEFDDGAFLAEADKYGKWALSPGIAGYWLEKQYLHELQNLFYCLEGQELEVKL